MQSITLNLEDLRKVRIFSDFSDETLQWLLDHGEGRLYDENDAVFEKGADADFLIAMTSGRLQIFQDMDGKRKPFATIPEGEVTGLLPYSRMKKANGYGVVLKPIRAYVLHRDYFSELEHHYPDVIQALISLMADRVKMASTAEFQQEKLLALGKLSAGLAHELNNPASAIKRTAAALREHIDHAYQALKDITDNPPSPDQISRLMELLKKDKQAVPVGVSMVQRQRIEEDIADWLEDHGLEDGLEFSENFMEMGIFPQKLDQIAEVFDEESLPDMLCWLNSTLGSQRLIRDIEDAAARISALVDSVKTYSHMDRAPDREDFDIHTGILSTLTMLGHEFRANNIEVERLFSPDLPKVNGMVNELNQVWTNLLDNAIDATPKGGMITVSTREEGGFAVVDISDTGSGIPADIQSRIFEPFFTTKKTGQGSGLGLDIVRKIIYNHGGEIQLVSKSGSTVFSVYLPLNKPESLLTQP